MKKRRKKMGGTSSKTNSIYLHSKLSICAYLLEIDLKSHCSWQIYMVPLTWILNNMQIRQQSHIEGRKDNK